MVVQGTFKPEGLSQAINIYEKLALASREEDGCLEYGIYQDVENDYALTVIESWETEQALETHMQSAHFQELVPQLMALRESVTLHRYEQII
jgi:quinol monooxygenase YgiN